MHHPKELGQSPPNNPPSPPAAPTAGGGCTWACLSWASPPQGLWASCPSLIPGFVWSHSAIFWLLWAMTDWGHWEAFPKYFIQLRINTEALTRDLHSDFSDLRPSPLATRAPRSGVQGQTPHSAPNPSDQSEEDLSLRLLSDKGP